MHEFRDSTELVHGLDQRVIRGAIVECLRCVRAVLRSSVCADETMRYTINVPEEDMPWPFCHR